MESIPPDPYQQQKYSQVSRMDFKMQNAEDEKLFRFLSCDRKVLRFYGTWKDVISDPPEIRRVILQVIVTKKLAYKILLYFLEQVFYITIM